MRYSVFRPSPSPVCRERRKPSRPSPSGGFAFASPALTAPDAPGPRNYGRGDGKAPPGARKQSYGRKAQRQKARKAESQKAFFADKLSLSKNPDSAPIWAFSLAEMVTGCSQHQHIFQTDSGLFVGLSADDFLTGVQTKSSLDAGRFFTDCRAISASKRLPTVPCRGYFFDRLPPRIRPIHRLCAPPFVGCFSLLSYGANAGGQGTRRGHVPCAFDGPWRVATPPRPPKGQRQKGTVTP
jgi:hypothetical protein